MVASAASSEESIPLKPEEVKWKCSRGPIGSLSQSLTHPIRLLRTMLVRNIVTDVIAILKQP